MGRPEVGLPLAVRAAAMAPNDAWVLTNLAWLQLQTKRYADALHTCGRAIAANPDLEWPHRLRGYALWHTGRPEAAASALAEAVRVGPTEVRALWTLAWFAAVVGRSEEALAAANRAVELEPENASCWFSLGWAARASHEWDTAETALLRARSLNPGGANEHNNLGTLYLALGRLEEAKDCFESAVAIDPRSEYPFLNLARCLRRLGRWEEAADLARRHWLERLHEADERVANVGDYSAYRRRAQIEECLLRFPAAAEDLGKAARLAETPSESASAKGGAVSVALSQERLDEAHALAAELLQDHADESGALRVAAHVGWLANDLPMAERAAQLAEQQGIGERTESFCSADAALAAGEWSTARAEIEPYLPELLWAMQCCVYATVAYASFRAGDSQAADGYLRVAADENPDCDTLRLLEKLELMPVKELLPAEIRPWLLSEQPLA